MDHPLGPSPVQEPATVFETAGENQVGHYRRASVSMRDTYESGSSRGIIAVHRTRL